MSSWSERAAVALPLLIAFAACQGRPVDVRIHTPRACCDPAAPECEEPACPLSALRSLRTVLEGADGTVAADECAAIEEVCSFEDLTGFVFIDGVSPSDGFEVRIEGYATPDCDGDRFVRCDSFGDNVIDLRETDVDVPVWCDCPAPP